MQLDKLVEQLNQAMGRIKNKEAGSEALAFLFLEEFINNHFHDRAVDYRQQQEELTQVA